MATDRFASIIVGLFARSLLVKNEIQSGQMSIKPILHARFAVFLAGLVLVGIACHRQIESGPTHRDFYRDRHEALVTFFTYNSVLDYSSVWFRRMGIATGGETRFKESNGVIFRSTLIAIDPNARSLAFKAVYLKDGNMLITADVLRDMSCRVRSVTFNGAFRSDYFYNSVREPIPSIKTIDTATGKVLSTASNVEIENDGTFRVQEIDYKNDQEVFRSFAQRNTGTGLLISEKIQYGVPERDYHHYELMLDRWSGCEPQYR